MASARDDFQCPTELSKNSDEKLRLLYNMAHGAHNIARKHQKKARCARLRRASRSIALKQHAKLQQTAVDTTIV